MNNTSLIFIPLHINQIEYFININKIISIAPRVDNNNDGSVINTVSSGAFYCKESVSEVIKLMDEAFKARIENTDYKRYLK